MLGSSATAQLASSEICQLETLAFTGGGATAVSTHHQIWSSVGLGVPLASGSVTIHSSTHAMQMGLIPTLYPRGRPGDANGDGLIDAADIVRAGNHLRQPGTWPLPIENLFSADVDCDTRITSQDLAGIADLIVGLR
jgi:Dockerin type I domain